MRNFIYLDTDFLASFMAQENDGLETIRNIESDTYDKSLIGTPTTTKKVSMSTEANVAIAKGNLASEKTIESELNINESSELYKEMVSRVLHDNVFNYFENYINNDFDHCVDKPMKDSIGKYINHRGGFETFDITFLEKICDQKFLKELFILAEGVSDMQNVNSQVNLKNINQYKLPNDIYNTSVLCTKLVNIFKTIFPTDTVLIMDNMMVIINDKYLREDIKSINFKYSGQMSVVGIINRVYDEANKKSTSPFMEVLNSVSECGIELINAFYNRTSKELYIVTPIAIYF
nr:hypothetical protein [uncultured Cellulosilyticum sp.]